MKIARGVDKRAIRDQLERIVNSPDFDTSLRSREFIRFVVEETLAGHRRQISQQSIGTSVFGRSSRFNPSTDPIVRMQAARVRRSLEHYYLTSGSEDPVVIEIPKGTYVPVFHHRETVERSSLDDSGAVETEEASGDSGSWPTLLVTPFRNLTGDKELDFIAQGLASDLAIELDRYREVRVFLGTSQGEGITESQARFIVEGNIDAVSDGLKISARLMDGMLKEQMWARRFRCKRSDPRFGVLLDELAQTLAATVAEERGILSRHLIQKVKSKRAEEPGAHEAILRFYHFDMTQSLGAYREALSSLRHAVDIEPECGLCWSLLARLYATNYTLEFADEETRIEDAVEFAQNGVRLEPTDQRTRLVLAYVRLLNDEVAAARREVDAAVSLNPDSLFFLDAIGYLLTLLGDWERGPALARKAVRLNPYHRDVVHAGLWLDALRRRDFESACREAEEYTFSGHFWQPLMRATALAHLGRTERAEASIEQLMLLKPDFGERGHWLITRHVKFEDLIEVIKQGLRRAGLHLA